MNLCLICSRNFKRKIGRPKKENVGNKKDIKRVKLLINYLLDNSATSFGNLKNEVFKNCEGGGVKDGFSLCFDCESLAEKLLELQLELEKVQMKIINQLRIVRAVVTEGCEEKKENKVGKGGDLLRVHRAFQDAVSEKGRHSVMIPLIYLERFGLVQRPIDLHETEKIVKTEPEEDQIWPNDEDFDQLSTDDLPSRLVIPVIPETILHNNLEEISLLEPEMKSERMETTKSKRSSAILARSRVTISQSKRLLASKWEARPRKKRKGVKKPSRSLEKKPISKSTEKKKSNRRCVYRCGFCNFECSYNCNLEEHLLGHETDDKWFQCELCDFTSSTQAHLDFHKGRHAGLYKLNCDICLENISALHLQDHIINHGEYNLIPCPRCSHYSSSPEKYLVHLKVHVVSPGVACYICLKHQKSRRELARHLHTDHGLLKKIPCDFEGCGAKFLLPDSLAIHKVIHTNPIQCDECLKCFSSQQLIKTHKLRVHSNLKPFKCDQCPAEFAGKDMLQSHMVREHGAPKFKCDVCGKEYPSNSGVRYHKIKEHDSRMCESCSICNRKFGSKYNLRMHMEAKHSKGNNYICEECGKGLDSLLAYGRHKRIHGEKKFKCSFCQKAFAMQRYLVEHERTHTGERPFVCAFCGRAFNQKGARGVHQKGCKQNSNL